MRITFQKSSFVSPQIAQQKRLAIHLQFLTKKDDLLVIPERICIPPELELASPYSNSYALGLSILASPPDVIGL